MQPVTYHKARSAQDAIAAYRNAGERARYISGGTTLYDLMKLGVERPAHLIDVSDIDSADAIVVRNDVLLIGAGCRMADVARNELIRRAFPILVESLEQAASPTLRNMATVAGNLLQRTRCPYFRFSGRGEFPCNKREPGSGCAAIGGSDRGQALFGASASCSAVSPGDWPVALTALGARIHVIGIEGPRQFPISDLYRSPGSTPELEFGLEPADLLTTISIPLTDAGLHSTYRKVRDRASFSFALVSAAVALSMDGDLVRRAHVALGGVATTPWRATRSEQMLSNSRLDSDLARRAAEAAFEEAKAGIANSFKIELGIRNLREALLSAAQR